MAGGGLHFLALPLSPHRSPEDGVCGGPAWGHQRPGEHSTNGIRIQVDPFSYRRKDTDPAREIEL